MKRKIKYCKLYYCNTMKERVCCNTCPNLKKCKNPCINNLVICGKEDKNYIPKKERRKNEISKSNKNLRK